MTMLDGHKLAATGLLPPQRGEVLIRETWPGVEDVPAVAGLAHALMRTVVLAPLEVISKGQVALTMRTVKDPESFRRAILNTRSAWGKSAAAAAKAPAESKT